MYEMATAQRLPATELPESLLQRIQEAIKAGAPLSIEGENGQVVGYFVSPQQLQRMVEDAYTETLLSELNNVVKEVRRQNTW